ILTDKGGKIEFRDMIAGVTIKREVDEATGLMGTMVIEHKEDLHPQVVIVDDKKEVVASYSIPAGAHVIVEEAQKVRPGALLAKTPRKVAKTKDITGGLPRVAELFEARRPKDAAEIAKIDGIVELGGTVRGKRSSISRKKTRRLSRKAANQQRPFLCCSVSPRLRWKRTALFPQLRSRIPHVFLPRPRPWAESISCAGSRKT